MTIYSDGSCSQCGDKFPRVNPSQTECSVACRLKASVKVDANGCWKWMKKTRTINGYGVMAVEGRNIGAHRASYEAFVGPIPDGLFVCHKCDVRDCVNPDHLFVGTRLENMQDAAAKKRMPRMEGHPNAKLTADDVRAIKSDNASLRKIAAKYGVGQTAIFRIKHGEYWRDVA